MVQDPTGHADHLDLLHLAERTGQVLTYLKRDRTAQETGPCSTLFVRERCGGLFDESWVEADFTSDIADLIEGEAGGCMLTFASTQQWGRGPIGSILELGRPAENAGELLVRIPATVRADQSLLVFG